jgi:hypothetical protein
MILRGIGREERWEGEKGMDWGGKDEGIERGEEDGREVGIWAPFFPGKFSYHVHD